jgi:hypothetical protein
MARVQVDKCWTVVTLEGQKQMFVSPDHCFCIDHTDGKDFGFQHFYFAFKITAVKRATPRQETRLIEALHRLRCEPCTWRGAPATFYPEVGFFSTGLKLFRITGAQCVS